MDLGKEPRKRFFDSSNGQESPPQNDHQHGSCKAVARSQRVLLDVGGKQYRTTIDSLKSVPGCYFDTLLSGRWSFQPDSAPGEENGELHLFVDRSYLTFEYILMYLRGDCFVVDISALSHQERAQLLDDARFFGIPGLMRLFEPHFAWSALIARSPVNTQAPCWVHIYNNKQAFHIPYTNHRFTRLHRVFAAPLLSNDDFDGSFDQMRLQLSAISLHSGSLGVYTVELDEDDSDPSSVDKEQGGVNQSPSFKVDLLGGIRLDELLNQESDKKPSRSQSAVIITICQDDERNVFTRIGDIMGPFLCTIPEHVSPASLRVGFEDPPVGLIVEILQ